MPRSGPNGTYTLPGAQATQQPGTPIPSAVNNQGYSDIEQTFNTVQPEAYGGTGASTYEQALGNLGGISKSVDQSASADPAVTKVTILKNTLQAWEHISTQSYGAAARYDFTNLGDFRSLRLSGVLLPAQTNATLLMRVSSDNGVTVVSTDYDNQSLYGTQAGTTVSAFSSVINGALIAVGGQSNNVFYPLNFSTDIQNFNQALYTQYRTEFMGVDQTPANLIGMVGGRQKASTARNAIILLPSVSTWAGAFLTLEGVRG
jgi:hypothetical protein